MLPPTLGRPREEIILLSQEALELCLFEVLLLLLVEELEQVQFEALSLLEVALLLLEVALSLLEEELLEEQLPVE